MLQKIRGPIVSKNAGNGGHVFRVSTDVLAMPTFKSDVSSQISFTKSDVTIDNEDHQVQRHFSCQNRKNKNPQKKNQK